MLPRTLATTLGGENRLAFARSFTFTEPEHLIAFDGATPGTVKSLREFLPAK